MRRTRIGGSSLATPFVISYASFRANHTDMKLHILADLMGHKKLDTTRKYISRSRKEEQKQSKAAFADWDEQVRQNQ